MSEIDLTTVVTAPYGEKEEREHEQAARESCERQLRERALSIAEDPASALRAWRWEFSQLVKKFHMETWLGDEKTYRHGTVEILESGLGDIVPILAALENKELVFLANVEELSFLKKLLFDIMQRVTSRVAHNTPDLDWSIACTLVQFFVMATRRIAHAGLGHHFKPLLSVDAAAAVFTFGHMSNHWVLSDDKYVGLCFKRDTFVVRKKHTAVVAVCEIRETHSDVIGVLPHWADYTSEVFVNKATRGSGNTRTHRNISEALDLLLLRIKTGNYVVMDVVKLTHSNLVLKPYLTPKPEASKEDHT